MTVKASGLKRSREELRPHVLSLLDNIFESQYTVSQSSC